MKMQKVLFRLNGSNNNAIASLPRFVRKQIIYKPKKRNNFEKYMSCETGLAN